MQEEIRIVTVSGPPGSGTSTVSRLLSEELEWAYVNAGQIFRQLAKEAGGSLADYGQRAEEDPQIDQKLDARMVETARQLERVILEGRMTGWMAQRHGLPALKVWLEASAEARAGRISERDSKPMAQALEEMVERERSEAKRYCEIHNIDIGDRSIYDLRIDTELYVPAQIAEKIIARLREE